MMIKKIHLDDIVKNIKRALKASESTFPIAVLCDYEEVTALCEQLSELLQCRVVMLKNGNAKYKLKNELNIIGSKLIIYEGKYESMIYEILNDGTTFLNDALLLDDYIK